MTKIAVALVLFGVVASAHADSVLFGNAARGEKLVRAHCTACHGSEIYTRPNHMIHDSSALAQRVRYCSRNTHANFNDKQVTDVVKYLNDTFYHFEK